MDIDFIGVILLAVLLGALIGMGLLSFYGWVIGV